MRKDVKVFLEHILESITKIEEFTKGISRDNFHKSAQLQDAVIRRLEIIGEAAKMCQRGLEKNTAICPGVKWPEPETNLYMAILA